MIDFIWLVWFTCTSFYFSCTNPNIILYCTGLYWYNMTKYQQKCSTCYSIIALIALDQTLRSLYCWKYAPTCCKYWSLTWTFEGLHNTDKHASDPTHTSITIYININSSFEAWAVVGSADFFPTVNSNTRCVQGSTYRYSTQGSLVGSFFTWEDKNCRTARFLACLGGSPKPFTMNTMNTLQRRRLLR